MDKKLFNDLLDSVRDAGRIKRGEAEASRRAEITPVDVKAIRARTGLSQTQFARLICVPVRTLRNWEQGRRHPVGAAVALLRIIERDPEHTIKVSSRFRWPRDAIDQTAQGADEKFGEDIIGGEASDADADI